MTDCKYREECSQRKVNICYENPNNCIEGKLRLRIDILEERLDDLDEFVHSVPLVPYENGRGE